MAPLLAHHQCSLFSCGIIECAGQDVSKAGVRTSVMLQAPCHTSKNKETICLAAMQTGSLHDSAVQCKPCKAADLHRGLTMKLRCTLCDATTPVAHAFSQDSLTQPLVSEYHKRGSSGACLTAPLPVLNVIHM